MRGQCHALLLLVQKALESVEFLIQVIFHLCPLHHAFCGVYKNQFLLKLWKCLSKCLCLVFVSFFSQEQIMVMLVPM